MPTTRQAEAAPRRHFRLPQALVYIFPLLLLVLYLSAVATPPERHTELVRVSEQADSGDPATLGGLQKWEEQEGRDWEWGSVTVERTTPEQEGQEQVQTIHATEQREGKLARFAEGFAEGVEDVVQRIGDFIVMLFGLEDDDEVSGAQDGSGLTTWSESSVYVELTHSLYASRPSSFGPHILLEPLEAPLYPITAFAPSTSHACGSPDDEEADNKTYPSPPRFGWIALVQRGHCPFSAKVRYAQERGAVAVVFGDQSPEEGGISGVGGLLTPWSPDDTSDIRIPSAFVSRASYLSLLQSWADEQPPSSTTPPDKPVGLLVILSKDELFAWPLLDLLLLILFLPSLLTLLTVFTQRLRIIRQQQRERAPRDAVARLPVFLWGEEVEKPAGTAVGDEEARVGGPSDANESTSLLRPELPEQRRSRWGRWVPTWVRRTLRSQFGEGKHVVKLAPMQSGRTYDTTCPICLGDFEKGEKVIALPCLHIFHQEEIIPWLLDTKRHCPVCRASILADSDDDADHPSSPSASTSAPPPPAAAQALPLPRASVYQHAAPTSTIPSSPSSAPAALPTRQPQPLPVASGSGVTLENGVEGAREDGQ